MAAATGVRYLNTEAGDTTRICPVRRSSQRPSCSFSETTCGWTGAPEPCSWTSPSTMATSTSSASLGDDSWFYIQYFLNFDLPACNYRRMDTDGLYVPVHFSDCWQSFLLPEGWWPPGSSKQCVWCDTCPAGTTLWVCVRWHSAFSSCTTWWRRCWRSASTACTTSRACGTVWMFSFWRCVSRLYRNGHRSIVLHWQLCAISSLFFSSWALWLSSWT